MCELGVFPIFLRERERSFKSGKNPSVDFFLRQEKTLKDSKRRFSIYCSWVLSSMDCLQLPFIREEAVSWTQRFLTRKIWPTNRSLFTKTNLKAIFLQKFDVNSTGRRRLYLEQPGRHFCQYFIRRTTQQTFLAVNLAFQQKKTKLYFSSQVRRQFKLLMVPFKPYILLLFAKL